MNLKRKIETIQDSISYIKPDNDGKVYYYHVIGLLEILKDFMDIKTDDLELKNIINTYCLDDINKEINELEKYPEKYDLNNLNVFIGHKIRNFFKHCHDSSFVII